MKRPGEKNQYPALKVAHREFLVKDVLGSHSQKLSYDRSTLKRVLKHLSKEKKKKKKVPMSESCWHFDYNEGKVDRQVKLRCRQLPNVVDELRRAVMKQDWDEATTLTTILCCPGLKYYSSIILRMCFILLFSHPSSNSTVIETFIRLTSGYILEEDIKKFITILFILREISLKPLKSGKHIRKTGDYKVIRDPMFEKL